MVVVPYGAGGIDWRHAELRVLLVEGRPLFLAALAELIRGAWPQAAIDMATKSDHALELLQQRSVDLLFCEVRAVPLTGPELCARIEGLELKTRVVLLADKEDEQLLIASLRCGAAGFFTKDASPEEFLEGVGAVLAGHYVVGRNLFPLTLAAPAGGQHPSAADRMAQLSEAERSILLMLGQAQSTRAIAASRGTSQKTVRNHIASIYRKLAVRNRTEAIMWSARAGLRERTLVSCHTAD